MSNRCDVIAIVNQKGGVGKTAITCNVGIGLVHKGYKVLVIDADPQGNLSSSLGIDNPGTLTDTLSSYIEREITDNQVEINKYIIRNDEGIDIIPCNMQLAGLEYMMMNALRREYIVSTLIDKVKSKYDYILIDCSPSLNLVTVNVLTAATSVIIPVEAAYLSLAGLQQLIYSISTTKKKLNKNLHVEGIVVNKVNTRTVHEKSIIDELQNAYGNSIKVFNTMIPESVRAKECTAYGVSIYKYDSKCKVAKAYENLVEEIIA